MATIGTFTLDRDGSLKGQIKTLNLSAEVSMYPSRATRKALPLTASTLARSSSARPGPRRPRRAAEHHQVRLDDPSFPAPIFANLVEHKDSGSFALIWNRPPVKPRGEGDRRRQSR